MDKLLFCFAASTLSVILHLAHQSLSTAPKMRHTCTHWRPNTLHLSVKKAAFHDSIQAKTFLLFFSFSLLCWAFNAVFVDYFSIGKDKIHRALRVLNFVIKPGGMKEKQGIGHLTFSKMSGVAQS